MPLSLPKDLLFFFSQDMEFVDTVTPSLGQYQHQDPWNALPFRDWANYKDWLQMYVPNAFNAAMLNYQNEYNRPVNQMLRYQEAGINPYSVVGNISASSAEGKPGQGPTYQGTAQWQKGVQNALSAISTTAQLVGTAKEIYDYIKFGKEQSFQNSLLAGYNADIASLKADAQRYETAWTRYWNTGQDTFDDSGNPMFGGPTPTPRQQYMAQSTEEKMAHIAQLEALVKILYPSQASAASANAALASYKKEVLKGQTGAILNINTGDETRDSILKLIAMWLLKQ